MTNYLLIFASPLYQTELFLCILTHVLVSTCFITNLPQKIPDSTALDSFEIYLFNLLAPTPIADRLNFYNHHHIHPSARLPAHS